MQARLVEYFQSVPAFNQPVIMFQPIGGMDLIAKGLEQAVKPHIKYEAEVREIRQTPDGVRIVYYDKESGETREETGDYCVSAMPLSILIKIPGDFSGEVQQAMRAVAYATAGKVGLQMKCRFWEEDDRIFGGHTYTNLPLIGTISYPSNGYQTEKGLVQGYYNFGLEAIEMSARSPQERIDYALEQGNKIHPQYRENFETGFSIAWHRVPYTLGAWGTWSASARQNSYPKMLRPDGRIYFAGESLSYLEGWQAGAIESAWQTMEKLHERVKQG